MRNNNYSFKNTTSYISTIGSGTQGIVEKHEKQNGEIVAIKQFFSQGKDIDGATLKELNIFQKLKNCPTINQLMDVDIVIKKSYDIYIMMPFHQYSLSSISDILSQKQKVNQLPLIMNNMFNALYNLYHIGVIHADIKPDNILVDIVDSKMKLYLADFGLCIQVPCETTYRYIKKPIHGSPIYMAPELLTVNHYYDEKIDIWSTGITILDFLTNTNVTDPSNDLLDMAGDPFVGIIFKILELLKVQEYPTIELYQKIKNNQFHGAIDVDLILSLSLTDDAYNAIPKTTIDALTRMLQVNTKDRIHIKDLYNGKLCGITNVISRGDMVSKIPLDEFYHTIYKLIKYCDNENISPVTFYLSIDLLERYLANFEVKSIKKLHIYACAILMLNHKLYESEDLSISDLMNVFGNEFTYDELLFTQLFVLKKFNYLLTTCETDDMIHALNTTTHKELKNFNFNSMLRNIKLSGDLLEEFKIGVVNRKIIYPTLLNTYKQIEQSDLYSGSMFPFEIVEIYNSF